MVFSPTLSHDPKDVALYARQLVHEHGEQAEQVATDEMYKAMDVDDVNKAAIWLTIISEIREMAQATTSVN